MFITPDPLTLFKEDKSMEVKEEQLPKAFANALEPFIDKRFDKSTEVKEVQSEKHLLIA